MVACSFAARPITTTQRETVSRLDGRDRPLLLLLLFHPLSTSFNSRQSFRSCIITCLCGEGSGQEEDVINGGTIA